MSEEQDARWIDRNSKLLIPLVSGVVIAVLGFISNYLLKSYANARDNARLVSELQLEREKAESSLRQQIFSSAINSLIGEDREKRRPDADSSYFEWSKHLLKLELLAHNFGDSLSLSPLFGEFAQDLRQLKSFSETRDEWVKLESRLRGLAKRVADNQLLALAQHGALREIEVPLAALGFEFDYNHGRSCPKTDVEDSNEYKWPYHYAIAQARSAARDVLTDAAYACWTPQNPLACEQGDFDQLDDNEGFLQEFYCVERSALGTIELEGVTRQVEITLHDLSQENKTVGVDLEIYLLQSEDEVENDNSRVVTKKSFTLNYFNFPKVDNTRLSDNQRAAVVLTDFDSATSGSESDEGGDTGRAGIPSLNVAFMVFPAEYSSLRDRPSMRESVRLLEKSTVTGERK